MIRTLFLLAMAVSVGSVLTGCSLFNRDKKPKSSAHLYEGDGPSIKFSDEPEAAGGPINPY